MSLSEACNVHDFVLSASALSVHNLDLSRKGISEIPADLPDCKNLECLYLEGNKLSVLPDSLFICCPNLRWLDLRNNHLISIPPSIEKLKSLRTLLLEGNRLCTLPHQLGRLPHLTGLNLMGNPLKSPPKCVIEKGTKAVLKYLQESLKETMDEDSQKSDSESSLELTSSRQHSTGLSACSHSIHPIPTLQSKESHSTINRSLPLLEQAQIHSKPSEPNTQKYLTASYDNKESFQKHSSRKRQIHKNKTKNRNKGTDLGFRKLSSQSCELRVEDKLKIAAKIERKKADEILKDWRDETRDLKRQQDKKVRVKGKLVYQKTDESAPFATDSQSNHMDGSPTSTRLKEMEGNRENMLKLQDNSTDSIRKVRDAQLKARVDKHLMELATLRRQAGIISSPSAELLEAEQKLAEATVKHKDLETVKSQDSREYRLTAFTGDLPLEH